MASPPTPPRPARARRALWVLGVLLGLVLALRVVLGAVVGPAVEHYGGEALGRRVTVDGVSLSLLRGRVALEGLRVGRAEGEDAAAEPIDPATSLLRLDRVEAELDWAPLLERRVRLREVSLSGPQLRLARRPDGGLEPVVLAEPAPAEPGEPEPAAGSGWPIEVRRIAVRDGGVGLVPVDAPGRVLIAFAVEGFELADFALRGGTISTGAVAIREPRLYVDRDGLAQTLAQAPPPEAAAASGEPAPEPASKGGAAAPPAFEIASIGLDDAEFSVRSGSEVLAASLAFSATDLNAAPDRRFPLELELKLADGMLRLTGEAGIDPPAFDGELRWTALPLPEITRAVGGLPVALRSGRSDGVLKIAALKGAADVAPELRVSGRLGVDDLALADPEARLDLAWSSLTIDLDELVLERLGTAPRARIASLSLVEPVVKVALVGQKGEAPPAAEPPGTEPAEAAEAPALVLAQLGVERGRVEITEASATPPFDVGFRDVRVDLRDLRWPERDLGRAEVTAQGRRGSRLALNGSLHDGRGRFRGRLEKLDLAQFNAVAGPAAGLTFEAGEASLSSNVEVAPELTRLDNLLVLHGLDVEQQGATFESLFGVNLDLALAVLRDPQGNIAMPVPVQLHRGDLRVGLRSIMASSLRNALQGALASPFKLLGGVADVLIADDAPGLAPLAAIPGRPDLERFESERVAALAAALEERPALKLELRGRASDIDDQGIAEQMLVEGARTGDLPEIEGVGFFERRQLRSALAQEPPAFGRLDRALQGRVRQWIESAEIPAARRRELARARAEAVREQLVAEHGVDPERVVIGRAEEGTPGVAIGLAAATSPFPSLSIPNPLSRNGETTP